MTDNSPFPRPRDDKPHAWGLTEAEPQEIWERFSPDYERQAERLWKTFVELGLTPTLDWAGSEDGEGLLGHDPDGELMLAFHLESPHEAMALQRALNEGRIEQKIIDAIRQNALDGARYAAEDR